MFAHTKKRNGSKREKKIKLLQFIWSKTWWWWRWLCVVSVCRNVCLRLCVCMCVCGCTWRWCRSYFCIQYIFLTPHRLLIEWKILSATWDIANCFPYNMYIMLYSICPGSCHVVMMLNRGLMHTHSSTRARIHISNPITTYYVESAVTLQFLCF